MANVIESPMFFSNGATVAKLGKDGSVKTIGKQYREIPFHAKKWEANKDHIMAYVTSVSNVQGLEPVDIKAFNDMNKQVTANRKAAAIETMKPESWDSNELERQLDTKVGEVSDAVTTLADKRAELSALRNYIKQGPDAATKAATKAADKAKKAEADAKFKAAKEQALEVLYAQFPEKRPVLPTKKVEAAAA